MKDAFTGQITADAKPRQIQIEREGRSKTYTIYATDKSFAIFIAWLENPSDETRDALRALFLGYSEIIRPPIRRVKQIEARKGDFIDSYTDRQAFMTACLRMAKAAQAQNLKRELVYAIIPVGHKLMWQIFLLP